jgi:hypothetical protein
LIFHPLQLVEQTSLALRVLLSGLEGRNALKRHPRTLSDAGQKRQAKAGSEKQRRQNCRRAGQGIRLAASCHEAAAAANPDGAAFGALQQHRHDKRDNDHKVNNDQDRLHEDISIIAKHPCGTIWDLLFPIIARMASAEWFFAAKFQNAARFLDKISYEVKQLGMTESTFAGTSSRRHGQKHINRC